MVDNPLIMFMGDPAVFQPSQLARWSNVMPGPAPKSLHRAAQSAPGQKPLDVVQALEACITQAEVD